MEARRRLRPQPQDARYEPSTSTGLRTSSPSSSPTSGRHLNAMGSVTPAAMQGASPMRRDNRRRRWHAWIEIVKQAGPGGVLVALILAYVLWCLAARLVLVHVSGGTRHAHAKPRILAYYFTDDVKSSHLSRRHLPGTLSSRQPYPPHPRMTVEWTKEDEIGQNLLLNSQFYNNDENRALRPYQDKPECVPMHEWQTMTYPTCNNVHQIDLTDLSEKRNFEHRQVRVLAHGYFRDVWAVREYDGVTLQVFKTLRFRHDWNEWAYERHRMDAVTFSELTSSKRILDIYSFCGNSGAYEYAPGGAVSDVIYEEEPLPLQERFNIAVQMARAISDVHNFNHKAPAIVHADIYTNQFVAVDVGNGKTRYKLNDFNRCTFLYWNSTSNAGNCPYEYGDYNAWLYRSPEEYDYAPQTEKIDVYSMGNMFFSLLMGDDPFQKDYDKGGSKRVTRKVIKGKRPQLSQDLLESKDPIVKVLREAMARCHVHDWKERASAKEIAEMLTVVWKKCVAEGRCKPGPDDD